ncbi:M1 family aminopeptidase [Sphingomonas sp. PAMC 26621]|uniref:M1 family aminopeptidase n=1 Tax=Sphingomonas sp. PAMC 26621 TaxID=1112213 RepID=UPI001EE6623C|nr:M1 family aminopeptidase [Sphingomonas sp. PAMC 26621]
MSYRLALAPDIQNRTVAGRERITLRATMDGVQRLNFSANALAIETATLDGVALAHIVEGDVLGFDLPRPLRRGQTVKLELSYHGRPTRGFAGSATTLYTNYFACDWMVCSQNKFGEKAAFSVDLRVPTGMTSLSVGSMIARRPRPDGTEIHSWKAPRPYSAYLYGFAIGQFTRVKERAGSKTLIYLSDAADTGELKRRFAGTSEAVAFLSAKAGVPLPVADYSQLLVGGDEAQEAATYSVLGTDALPTTVDDSSEDWAIVHELTHQWWGNLITCETLRDFWLNEGITTFMTAAWKEHRYGRVAYEAELNVARSRLEKAWAKGFDKPLAWDGTYPTLGIRRAIQYSKGALFMAQLRTTLGDVAFWSGLRRYTRDHAGGTVTSIDLERAMEASSGQDLHSLFAEWVFGDGLLDRHRE